MVRLKESYLELHWVSCLDFLMGFPKENLKEYEKARSLGPLKAMYLDQQREK